MIVFTGYDSAWGGRQNGAVCHLVGTSDRGTLRLRLESTPTSVDWNSCLSEIKGPATDDVNLHVVAIDQGLVVPNSSGMRPVEASLASALMRDFKCGAHASNTGNASCYGESAGIWELLRRLENLGYRHEPMAIPNARSGSYFFECYPHPALIGLLDLGRVSRYKVQKRDPRAWNDLVESLSGLLPNGLSGIEIHGLGWLERLEQTKANEDALDALISAVVGVVFWKSGTERSTVLGSLQTGYIVTPHSETTRARFLRVFGDRLNQVGVAPSAPPEPSRASVTPPDGVEIAPASPQPERPPTVLNRSGTVEVTVTCTDHGNLWCNANPWMDRDRCEGWSLILKFRDVDGDPEVLFVPFRRSGHAQGGMRVSQFPEHRDIWSQMANGATRNAPLQYSARAEYRQLV